MNTANNSIKIVCPFYNATDFIETSIMSSIKQKYSNFKIILINDCSTDTSDEKIKWIIDKYSEFIVYIKNEQRMGAMYNHQYAVFEYCKPEDIIVQMDGDDMFPNNGCLEYINSFYNTNKCMMMYGQATYASGRQGVARPYVSREEFDNKRNLDFYVSHIRTFRAEAFFEIKKQDPELSCFKDANLQWYQMSCDVAMMYPVMEVCGYDNVKYNSKSLYIYNDSNPISDVKLDMRYQYAVHQEILKKKPFKKAF